MHPITHVVLFLVFPFYWQKLAFSKDVLICVIRSQVDSDYFLSSHVVNQTVQSIAQHTTNASGPSVGAVWLDISAISRGQYRTSTVKLDECSLVVAMTSCESLVLVHLLLSVIDSSTPSLFFSEGECLEGSTVALLPWTRHLGSAVSTVLSQLEWSNVLFISDGFAPHVRTVLQQTLTRKHLGVVHVEVKWSPDRANDTGRQLLFNVTGMIPPTVHSVVLCVGPDTAVDVIKQAKELHILSRKYEWLLACSPCDDPASFLPFLPADSRLALLRPVNTKDSLCEEQENNMAQALAMNEILKYIPQVNKRCTPTSDEDQNCSTSANDADQDGFELWSYVSHDHAGSFERVGRWREGQGWQMKPASNTFANVFRGFGNRTLRIGTIQASPFVFRRTVNNQTVYEGFCMDILGVLATRLNFRYEIVESPDGKYGAPTSAGGWNGMVGMVARGEADMGVGPYTITAIRETVIDFSLPYMEDGGGILTKKGDSNAASVTGLSPFSLSAWLALLATVLTVSLAFYYVVRFSPYSEVCTQEEKESYWSVMSCVMSICSSVLMQGMERHPRSMSARCLLGFWWLFSILIVSTYTATLTSVLTVDVAGDTIDAIDDLLRSPVKPLVLTGSLWDTTFQTANDGVFKKVAELMKDMPEVTSEQDALDHVLSGKMALLHDISNLQYMYSQDCKRLHLAKKLFQSNGFGIIMPENAPYKDTVNNLILRLQEGGFLDKWRAYWWPINGDCGPSSAASVSQAEQLGIGKIRGLIIAYIGVATLALLVFAIALCVSKCGPRVGKRCKTCWGKRTEEG